MKFHCKSCGQGHLIPDETVLAAGDRGLRVRCSRCRAIMAVDEKLAQMSGDDTAPDLPVLKRKRRVAVAGGAHVEFTDIGRLDEEEVPIPAVLRQGRIEPIHGVAREVTGVHFQQPRRREKKKATPQAGGDRVWFAAIGGKPRGPYNELELRVLAEQGRLRGRTRVWCPAYTGWMRVRSRDEEAPGLDWLREVVVERKRAERRATDRAREELGIRTLTLDNRDVPAVPPPLPADADADLRAGPLGPELTTDPTDLVFGAPQLQGGAVFATLSSRPDWTPSQLNDLYPHRQKVRLAVASALWLGVCALLGLYTAPWLVAWLSR